MSWRYVMWRSTRRNSRTTNVSQTSSNGIELHLWELQYIGSGASGALESQGQRAVLPVTALSSIQ